MAFPESNPLIAADDTTSEVVVTRTGFHPPEPHVLKRHTSKTGTCSADKFEFEFPALEKLMADELHASYLNRLSTSRNMESKLFGMMKKKYEEALDVVESKLPGLRENIVSQQTARVEAEEKWRVAVEELAKLQADFIAYKKTDESKEAVLTKRAEDAEGCLNMVTEELTGLKRHISRMIEAIFGQRSRQLSSDSLLKLKAVYTLTEQLYCATLCTIKAIMDEKSILKFMKGVIELLSTLPKQVDELKRLAVRKGAMAALSRSLAFAPKLTAEEMMDDFPSKKDDGSEFTEADYAKCVKAFRVLASTLVDEIDLSSYQAAYSKDSKRVRGPTFEARDLTPALRKPLFAPEIDPSPFFDEAQFEALTNCNWGVDNLQIKEVEDSSQDDSSTN